MRRATTMLFTVAAAIGLVWATAGSAAAGGGCHGVPPGAGSGTTVKMDQNCFYPAVLHTDPGARVTWINSETVDHTVTGVGDSWGSYDSLAADARVSFAFEEDGVYVYSCIIHPGMVGAVVVGDGIDETGGDAAAVVALPGADTDMSARDEEAGAASVGAATGDAWVPVAVAIGVGVLVGGVAVAAFRRPRRGLAPSA